MTKLYIILLLLISFGESVEKTTFGKLDDVEWYCTTWIYQEHQSPPIDTGYFRVFNQGPRPYQFITNGLDEEFYVFNNTAYNRKDVSKLIFPWCSLTLHFTDINGNTYTFWRELYTEHYCVGCRKERVNDYERVSDDIGCAYQLLVGNHHLSDHWYLRNYTKIDD